MGSYDPGMNIWGGENLEISFRTWQVRSCLSVEVSARVRLCVCIFVHVDAFLCMSLFCVCLFASPFLDTSSHLCLSVGRSVGQSLGQSVRPSAGHAFVKNGENRCSHVITKLFHHHEDASLALWALL